MAPSKLVSNRVGLIIALLAGGSSSVARLAAQDIDLSAVGTTLPGFVINGIAAGDRSGTSVSGAGDVNGDGLADVIVGAPNGDPPGLANAGRSTVVFGKSGSLAVDLSTVATGTSTLGFVINGEAADDVSGVSVSTAGDVNGDGLADLVVGAAGNDLPPIGIGNNNSGRSYVVFGKASGSAVELSAVAMGTGGFAINGQGALDLAGRSVCSAGDVNGDGLADVLVGAPESDPTVVPAGGNAGRSYVVFGKTSGIAVELSAVASGTSALGFVINGHDADQNSGRSVSSAGDVNGDGLADVIIGAPASAIGSAVFVGRSFVVFGKPGGTAVDLSTIITGASTLGFVINGQAGSDFAGDSVSAAGDVNGDGLADVIVGAPRSDPAGIDLAGRSYVVFGKTDGATVNLVDIPSGTSTLGFVLNGEAELDTSGASVASAGDVNGDGLADVIVGAPYNEGGGLFFAGRSYVVFGKTSTTPINLSTVATGTSGLGFVLNGQALDDRSGSAVSSAGDVNGDGLSDVIVGADFGDPAGVASAGRSYVVFSPLTPASSVQYRAQVASGDRDRQGIGVHRFGDDDTIFPDSRAWVDFDGGSGSGPASSSQVQVDFWHFAPFVFSPPDSDIADVSWTVQTDRIGWSECRVTVRYTDAEIVGLTEGLLKLYYAPLLSGPFEPIPSPTLDTARNEASGIITFAPSTLILTDYVPPSNGDANADGNVDVADYTAIRNDIEGIEFLPFGGDGDVDNDFDVDLDDADALREFLINGTPLP